MSEVLEYHPDGTVLDPTPFYAYIIVRTDLPLADQLCQVAHACLEGAWTFPRPHHLCYVRLLAVPNEGDLGRFSLLLQSLKIKHYIFVEPDLNGGEATAMCVEPLLDREKIKPFAKLKKWPGKFS